MRTGLIVVDDFYDDPAAVRSYAARQAFYAPYQSRERQDAGEAANWLATRFRPADECPFKSSTQLIEALERATGESVDLDHWKRGYPIDQDGRPLREATSEESCLWNCSFHVKPGQPQPLGEGVHNHVTDVWNSVGPDGWAGIVYLNEDAPLAGGLKTWRNRRPRQNFDWMSPAENWELVDDIGNLCNRLVLARGDVPHSGSEGWGTGVETGRLFQTFFFRTTAAAQSQGIVPVQPN